MKPRSMQSGELVVGVIGAGAIGGVLAEELKRGWSGLRFGGSVRRSEQHGQLDAAIDELISRCDVVVEAAGQDVVRRFGQRIIAAERDFFVLSVGAFAEDALLESLRSAQGGQLLISTGAIGGVDLLQACALSGGLSRVRLTTTKPSSVLELSRLGRGGGDGDQVGRKVVFSGSAREVVSQYPNSTNVAATIGLATLGLDNVEVELISAPGISIVSHRLQAWGNIGTYDFVIENAPSGNPSTSSITAYAVLRALRDSRAKVVVV